jgi:hypothetical protein
VGNPARDRERRARGLFPDVERPCAAGLHTIPAGADRCVPCKRANDRATRVASGGERSALATQLRALALPLAEILDDAVCSPEVAYLFDVGAPKHAKPAEDARHAAAKALCRRCPVAEACFAEAYAHRSMGVYGGRVMDQGFWTKDGQRRAKALVQSVQDVQDSPAC